MTDKLIDTLLIIGIFLILLGIVFSLLDFYNDYQCSITNNIKYWNDHNCIKYYKRGVK